MNDHSTERLETLVFDYEDDTIQGMLRFATEIRDRRLKYCRDRQAILQAQRSALAALAGRPAPPPSGHTCPAASNQDAPAPPRNNDMNQRPGEGQCSAPCTTSANFERITSQGPPNTQGTHIQQPKVVIKPATPTLPPGQMREMHLIPPPHPQFVDSCGSEGPPADRRAQSTPNNSCVEEGRASHIQFSPQVDTCTASQSPTTTKSTTFTQSSSHLTTERSARSWGGCRHPCAMIECPICQGALRVSLTPLCGDSVGTRLRGGAPTTTDTGCTTGNTSSNNTGSTLAQQQYLTDITLSGSSGRSAVQHVHNITYPPANFHQMQNQDQEHRYNSNPENIASHSFQIFTMTEAPLKRPSLQDLSLLQPTTNKNHTFGGWSGDNGNPPAEPFQCYLNSSRHQKEQHYSSESESEDTYPFVPSCCSSSPPPPRITPNKGEGPENWKLADNDHSVRQKRMEIPLDPSIINYL